jgi:hypothetical protein
MMAQLIAYDAVKNSLTYKYIASMLPSEPSATQLYIVQLDNMYYKMCFLGWKNFHMKYTYKKNQTVSTCYATVASIENLH